MGRKKRDLAVFPSNFVKKGRYVLIRLNDVTKVYPNGSKGVEGLNLHIKKGDFVFIVGSSGSGKSTLIKLLLKELDPTSGEIIINRVKTNELSRRQIPYLRRNLGVVFQDFRLLPNKTVYENVAFAMRVIEAPSRIIRRNVPAVLALVGLGQKGRSYPNQLSGGEQQRTALARAIVNNPKDKWTHFAFAVADNGVPGFDPPQEHTKSCVFVNGSQSGEVIRVGEAWRTYINNGCIEEKMPMTAFCRLNTDKTTREEYFSGYIKYMRIWKGIRSRDDLRLSAMGQVDVDPNDPNLVAAWDFEVLGAQPSGTTITDITGRHVATLKGPEGTYQWVESTTIAQ